MSKEDILVGLKDVPSFETESKNIVEILVDNNICSSKREAREFIGNGAILINDEKITDCDFIVNKDIAIEGSIIVLRKGKKKYYLGILK